MVTNISSADAQFIGVGVGPGDPELVTIKAARLIAQADVIAFLCNKRGESQSRKIVESLLLNAKKDQQQIAIAMPMLEDRDAANKVYDQGATDIQGAIDTGKQVVFLCEGDPLFFGSFSYLLGRLGKNNRCTVVPGISSVNAASAALCQPLAMLCESFAVVSGRHSLEQLKQALKTNDSLVIMKAGLSRARILQALAETGRTEDARYLEYIGRENELIENDVNCLLQESGPYFSIFVVSRNRQEFQ